MKRIFLGLALLVAAAVTVTADQLTADAQQVLKDQGFYYGQISGQQDSETKASIRRYQIRNGLKVSGELDAETRRSLGLGGGDVRTKPRPTATPRIVDEAEEEGENAPAEEFEEEAVPEPQPRQFDSPYQDEDQVPPVYGPAPADPVYQEGLFAGTPYERAPRIVQESVIASAQMQLARRGLYRSGVDGIFGPGTDFALRAFQTAMGLPSTGRFDMETLAALRLLPGQRGPAVRRGPRFFPDRYGPRGVLPGEWIR